MKILKINLADTGEVEFLNLEKIISFKPQGERVKILMGAGLYWYAERDTMEILELPQNFDEIITLYDERF